MVVKGEDLPKNAQSDDDIFIEATNRFTEVVARNQFVRDQCVEDRRFYSRSGAQWDGFLEKQFENKPRLEINKVYLEVKRIVNDFLSNSVQVRFVSRYGLDDGMADVCNAVFRADAQDYRARSAYSNCFREQVSGGIGAWRLRNVWEDEYDPLNDRQRIAFEPILEADRSVFFDPASKQQDKSDAKWCFVIQRMPIEEFEQVYGQSTTGWSDPIGWGLSGGASWIDYADDSVAVAEYYKVYESKKKIHVYETEDGDKQVVEDEDMKDAEIAPDILMRMELLGYSLAETKSVSCRKVVCYTLSGGGVLLKEDIPSEIIPVFIAYGDVVVIDGVELALGIVRPAKDPQRLKNVMASNLAYLATRSNVSKPIVGREQIAGNEKYWRDDNFKNYAFLPINILRDNEGNPIPTSILGYTKPPEVPPVWGVLHQSAEQDIKDVTGNQAQGEKVVANISEETRQITQERLGMQAYGFIYNFKIALEQCARCWLSMARQIYDEPNRSMKGIEEDESESGLILNQEIVDEDTGRFMIKNDISKARYSVVADVELSSVSQRSRLFQQVAEILSQTQDPQERAVLISVMVRMIDYNGVSDEKEFFRKRMVQMGVKDPSKEDLAEMQKQAQEQAQKPPDPQTLLMQATAQEAQARARESMADAALKETKIITEQAEAIRKKADVIDILSKIDASERENAVRNAQILRSRFSFGQPGSPSDPRAGVMQNGR